ncbi:MAG: hypothetical protein U1E38_09180 [Rhodospirillales bacterium]
MASENEGEGSRTAAKEYNERTKQFVEKGGVEAKAKEASAALESTEGEDLRQAEAEGRAHAHGEDPQVRRDK